MPDTATLTREVVSPKPARRAHRGRGAVIVAVGREDIHHQLEAAKQVAERLGANVRVVSVLPPIFVSEVAGAPVYVPAAEAGLDLRESISRMVEREVRESADDPPDMT